MSFMLRSVLAKNAIRKACLNKGQLTVVLRNTHSLRSKLFTSSPKNSNLIFRRLLSANAHDHSKLWVLEKVVSIGLLAVIPAALVYPNQILDYALALSLVIHVHWGFEAMVVDYVRPLLFGPVIPKVALGGLYLLSIAALAGLLYMNYSDVGLSTAVRMFAKA